MSTALDHLPEPDPVEIAARLRSYMGYKKISRSQLAAESGIGRTPLGAKLDGNGKFTLDELLAIARALDKSWLWVLAGDDMGRPPEPPHPPRAPSRGGQLLRLRNRALAATSTATPEDLVTVSDDVDDSFVQLSEGSLFDSTDATMQTCGSQFPALLAAA